MPNEIEEITLVDDEGNAFTFEVWKIVDVADQLYALLIPTDAEDEACVFRVERREGEEEILVSVEDDDEIARVAAALDSMEDGD